MGQQLDKPLFAKIGLLAFGWNMGKKISRTERRQGTGDVFLFSDHVDRERWRVLLLTHEIGSCSIHGKE